MNRSVKQNYEKHRQKILYDFSAPGELLGAVFFLPATVFDGYSYFLNEYRTAFDLTSDDY